jgi:hypothetical protein
LALVGWISRISLQPRYIVRRKFSTHQRLFRRNFLASTPPLTIVIEKLNIGNVDKSVYTPYRVTERVDIWGP